MRVPPSTYLPGDPLSCRASPQDLLISRALPKDPLVGRAPPKNPLVSNASPKDRMGGRAFQVVTGRDKEESLKIMMG